MKWQATGDSESPLQPLRTAKQRVDAACSRPSRKMNISPKIKQINDWRISHVKSSNCPLGIIAVGVAIASSVEQVLDPYDVVESFNKVRIISSSSATTRIYRLGT